MANQFIIRDASEQDAEAIITHTKTVIQENPDFFAMTTEEFNITAEEEVDWIKLHKKEGRLLVVEVNGRIIGILSFRLSNSKRFSHKGMFGMSIQEKYTELGAGSLLMEELLTWAKENNRVEKITLEVFSNNERAIHFYRKHGFTEEGRMRKNAKLRDGVYVDDILMSQFV